MFNQKELSRIISSVIHESISVKKSIENKNYCCEEELESLKAEAIDLDSLVVTISNLLER